MKRNQLLLGVSLFVLGLLGVLSMLTMDIPLPDEAREILEAQFSPQQIKLLMLVNPVILLIIAVMIGTILHEKVGLRVPVLEAIIRKEPVEGGRSLLMSGVIYGLIAGLLLLIVSHLFEQFLPAAFIELGEKLAPTLPARFLYGGITEEILMRFGLMTLMVYLASRALGGLKDAAYWIGLLVAAVIFAVGHFPVAFSVVEEPSAVLLSYILIGNTIGGIIFGWLYWKRGLEAAMLAHIFTHVVLVAGEQLI
jgi:membrane protease YdiL (CAAX protease family)